jgi:hypothetical protein
MPPSVKKQLVPSNGTAPKKNSRKMKAGSRPQYHRIRRMVQMVREGSETGYLPSSRDLMGEFGISRRTVARDLDFLCDEERIPLEYDEARHGFRLTSACHRCGSAAGRP